ncbi:hypothetical protein PN437_16135 [Microcystis aeruginosa CS-564/01]|uniref:hypothetical protein n=1 Tax=Microcystis aeruginosa TaxID=1126 RepID=UPI00232ADC89|nr:hypothetical protein [Microcystis aeruginosa]MDB9426399.1 hypothetical protein [Microcystis aeruginosa CS-564/01]
MARFILSIINNSGAAVNGIAPGVPPAWITTLTSPIANAGPGTVNINVPPPPPAGPPTTAVVRYSQAAGGIWQLLMTDPGPGVVAPNAAGSYTAPPAGHGVAIAPGPCPAGSPPGSICYNVVFT